MSKYRRRHQILVGSLLANNIRERRISVQIIYNLFFSQKLHIFPFPFWERLENNFVFKLLLPSDDYRAFKTDFDTTKKNLVEPYLIKN